MQRVTRENDKFTGRDFLTHHPKLWNRVMMRIKNLTLADLRGEIACGKLFLLKARKLWIILKLWPQLFIKISRLEFGKIRHPLIKENMFIDIFTKPVKGSISTACTK